MEVIVRTSGELREIIDQNPFQGQQSKASKWVIVMFLAARPDAAAQEDLLKKYTGPEEIFIAGKKLEYHSPIAETAPALSSVGTWLYPTAPFVKGNKYKKMPRGENTWYSGAPCN